MPEKETVLQSIQEICANKINTLHHSSSFARHQGVIKVTNGNIYYQWYYYQLGVQ